MGDLAGDSDCAICFLRYNRAGRAPRHLPCGHALCTRCLCEMLVTCAQFKGAQVSCPFCRAPTPLDATQHPSAVTSLPLDLGLFERLAQDPDAEDGEPTYVAPDDYPTPQVSKWSPWRKLKKMLQVRSIRESARMTRRRALGHNDARDLAMMTCYFV